MNPAIRSPIVREMIAQMPRYTVRGDAETRDALTPEERAIEDARAAQEAILFDSRPKKQKQDAARQRKKTSKAAGAVRYFEFLCATGNRNLFMINGVSAVNMLAGAKRVCESRPYQIQTIVRELYANRENITEEKNEG